MNFQFKNATFNENGMMTGGDRCGPVFRLNVCLGEEEGALYEVSTYYLDGELRSKHFISQDGICHGHRHDYNTYYKNSCWKNGQEVERLDWSKPTLLPPNMKPVYVDGFLVRVLEYGKDREVTNAYRYNLNGRLIEII